MTTNDLLKIQSACNYLLDHQRPRGCRCAGTCDRCRSYHEAERAIQPARLLPLVEFCLAQLGGA